MFDSTPPQFANTPGDVQRMIHFVRPPRDTVPIYSPNFFPSEKAFGARGRFGLFEAMKSFDLYPRKFHERIGFDSIRHMITLY